MSKAAKPVHNAVPQASNSFGELDNTYNPEEERSETSSGVDETHSDSTLYFASNPANAQEEQSGLWSNTTGGDSNMSQPQDSNTEYLAFKADPLTDGSNVKYNASNGETTQRDNLLGNKPSKHDGASYNLRSNCQHNYSYRFGHQMFQVGRAASVANTAVLAKKKIIGFIMTQMHASKGIKKHGH